MAVYSRKHKYLFMHIFRTGGMSLRQIFPGSEILGGHVQARDVKAHFLAKGWKSLWNEAAKFTVIRNPFDWMVSTYHYIVQKPGHNFHSLMQGKSLAWYLGWYREKMADPHRFGANMYCTLSDFIDDDSNTQIVDTVLKFENLPGCVHAFRQNLGLPKVPMPHTNITQRNKNYRSYYNAESRKLIETLFGSDLQRFGYMF